MNEKSKEVDWYTQPLSVDEVRANIKYALHREKDPKMLIKQMEFLIKELKQHDSKGHH